ncbi:MAG: class I SAM-dependent DNA methyltransferase, partial [Kiritimatiellae bacterium]|nr:class I SAM-dependent DNA methyltransferase [Kiritimatiellia bacterium]
MKKNRILFHALSENYKKIPGSPIAYWVGMELLKAWDSKTFVGSELTTREGMATADNAQFLRYWTEVSYARADFAQCDKKNSLKKWFPYNKGGAFRRWYGNNDYLVNWENNGTAIKSNQDPKTGRIRSHNYNGDFAFCEGITWSAISSNQIAVRYSPAGFLWDSKGAMGFGGNLLFYLGLLNSIVSEDILKILSPTLDFKVGDIAKIPLLEIDRSVVKSIVATLIDLSRSDWDEYETSWDFKVDPLVR